MPPRAKTKAKAKAKAKATSKERIIFLDEMGPVSNKAFDFVSTVFSPAKIALAAPEACPPADIWVCGDWRANRKKGITNQHGGIALDELLSRLPPPQTLIYFLLGASELSRAMRPRIHGTPAVDGWRRITQAGGRVLILQIRAIDARKPFTPEMAAEILPTIPRGSVVQWHQPNRPIEA